MTPNYTITEEGRKQLPVDRQFETYTIEKVVDTENYYELYFNDNSVFGIDKKDFAPKSKMVIKLYGKGLGYSVRGVVIDETPIYYRTEEEYEADFQEEQRQEAIKREENFEKNKDKLDADYNALPRVYQVRIDWFRKHSPRFRFDFESYELFVCKESLKIAKALETPDAVHKWTKMDQKEQKKYVDIDEGHSGNTFGCAALLAQLYCMKANYVILEHGALVYLCGCKDYGCFHNKKRIELAQPEESLYKSPYVRFLNLEI